MVETYQGACHCRRVTFEARASLDYVVECNCSICRMKGALWHPAPEQDLGVELAKLKVRQFDGVNWEATAKALLEKRR